MIYRKDDLDDECIECPWSESNWGNRTDSLVVVGHRTSRASRIWRILLLQMYHSFSYEAAVTEALYAISPSYVENPVAIDKEIRLIIKADYGVVLSAFHGHNKVSDVP